MSGTLPWSRQIPRYARMIDGMTAESLKLVFSYGSTKAISVLETVRSIMKANGLPTRGFTSSGERLDLTKLGSHLDQRYFDLQGHGLDLMGGSLPGPSLDFILISSDTQLGISWDSWVEAFTPTPSFTMGYLFDQEYDHWQNADDPQEFLCAGRSILGLPMKKNGIPPPLEKMIVDTSGNVGRWLFHEGYIEAVAATMWLSDRFWPLSQGNRDDVVSTEWLQVVAISPKLIKVTVAPKAFTSAEGVQGRQQRDLRRLLFPKSPNCDCAMH